MGNQEQSAIVRQFYDAYASMDIPKIDALMSDDAVMHVAGRHPLSGDKHGKQAVWSYVGKVAEVGGGQGGFDIRAITAAGEHVVALVTGTIRDFQRPIVHIWRVSGDQLVEFWDSSFDQAAEDAFWNASLPA